MSRLRPPPMEEPDKPVSEMTPTERAAYARQIQRAMRDDEVRRGVRPPKTMREMEIWHEAQAEREQRRTRRIDRAERRQERQGRPAQDDE